VAPTPSPDRWQQLEELFLDASELSPAERSGYLDARCDDLALRAEVEALLAQDDPKFATFVREIVVSGAQTAVSEGETGRQIGPYRILNRLGAGGMGAVYRAVRDDGVYTKEVAVKVLQLGLDSGNARERFRQERQILAGLEHPSIARLIDGGETESGLPYLVLEFVDGQDILSYCVERRLGTEARLRLFVQVCAAVHHAHQALVVHRDLKPANILVTEAGDVKLLDFGIAKLLEPDMARTATALVAMTPQYASPEQVRGEAVTTATDVYSLGVVLYELLTGRAPYQIKTMAPMDIDRAICQTEARPAGVSDDLDNILAMALQKEPRRRYASVREFAEDIERSLRSLPVRARPDTALYRACKFVRRNRLAVAAGTVAALGLTMGLAVAVQQARVARRQAAIAERRFGEVRKLANRFLFEFDKEIESVAGTTKAREMVVSTALEYLGRLAAEAGSDPELLAEVAEAYQKVADVQGNPSLASLGRTADALESYARSRETWERALSARPGHTEAMQKLASVWLATATVQRTLGQREESVESTKRGAEVAERGLAKAPNDAKLLGTLGAAWYRRGEDLRTREQFVEAREALETAAERYRRAIAIEPSARLENSLAVTEGRLAFTLVEHGRPEEALGHAETAVAIRRRLAAIVPPSAQYRRGLAIALQQLGDVYGTPFALSLGDSAKAEACYREALALTEDLAAKDQNNRTSQDDLLILRMKMANALESAAWARQALEGIERAGWDRNRADLRTMVGLAHFGLARGLLRQGRAREALASVDRAIADARKDLEGEVGEAVRGRILAAMGRRAEARTAFEAGSAKLGAIAPKDLGLVKLRDLALLYEAAGDCGSLARERELWLEWRRRQGPARYLDARLPAVDAALAGCPKL
jgi:tetratricopeptide (TPR) repeat protein/tRNA A-37 threonylcarbamoyl transferase component Bud32